MGALSEAAVNFRNASSGVIEAASDATWASVTGTWDTITGPWSQSTRREIVLCATDATKFLQLDSGTQNNGVDFTGTLQRTGLALVGKKRTGEWIADFTRRKQCNRLHIKATGGPINVRVGFQALPEGTITWSVAQSFNPVTDRWIDVAGSGQAVAVEFSAAAPFRVMGYKPEIELIGDF